MKSLNLTDNELWRAIAENTNALSLLIQKQLESYAHIGAKDPDKAKYLMGFHLEKAKEYQREYQECTAELRRRYPAT